MPSPAARALAALIDAKAVRAVLERHRREIARLRAAGDHRLADAMQAAVDAWLEHFERAQRRDTDG